MANNTQIEAALTETLPILPGERSWSFRHMLAMKGGLAIATCGFLAGGATGQRLGSADGGIALFCGTAIFAPTIGILLADWLVLRRGAVNVRVLHYAVTGSAYGFIAGFKPAAMIALAAGFVTYLALLKPVSYPPAAGFNYLSAALPHAKIVTHDIELAE